MNMRAPFFVGLLSLSSIACGSDSSGGDGSAGAGGQTGSAGTTGGGGAGTVSGLKKVTCSKLSSKTCTIYGESTDAGVESRKMTCTDGGGEVVEHCPADGLSGCCVVSGVGSCQYNPQTAATVMGLCTQQGGMWTTTAP